MSSLEDINEFAETHRAMTHKNMTIIAQHEHANCDHPVTQIVEDSYEHWLRGVDTATHATGQPWHIALKQLSDLFRHKAQQIQKEGADDD